jgi:hypothetical protein
MNYTEMISDVEVYGLEQSVKASKYPMAVNTSTVTEEITDRTKSLANAPKGSGHDNFLKGIIVQFDLTMTPKMSVELERYHFIDFVSSQSTMHRITKFDLDKSYIKYVDKRMIEIMKEKVAEYNRLSSAVITQDLESTMRHQELLREKYLEILYSNPCGFLLTARMTTNYQQLKTMYSQRKNHRLPEWKAFCDWVETLPYAKEFILENKEAK